MTVERTPRLDGELRRESEEPERSGPEAGPLGSMTRGREAASGEPRGPGRRTQVGLLEPTAGVAHPPGAPRDADAATGRRTRVGEGSSPGLGLDGVASGGPAGAANAATERDGEAASAQIAYYLQMRRRSGGSLALADGASRPPEQARFDDMRVQGLSTMLDVATAYGGPPLATATLGAADPPIASAASRGIAAGGAEGAAQGAPRTSHAAAGHAMWRASERYAASMYRRAVDGGDIAHSDPAVELALQRCGSGQSLPREVQRSMEGLLGVPLDRVRVHTDDVAAAAARAVHADAFTVGEDIFFAPGAFAPESQAGQRLLAHELTHVVQAWQGRTRNDGRVSQPSDSLEHEAEAMAARVGSGTAATAAATPGGAGQAHGAPAAPTSLPAARTQPILRRAAAGPAPSGGRNQTRAGARAPRQAQQSMQTTGHDFAKHAGNAATQATGRLTHEVKEAKSKSPGKRAHDQVKNEHRAARNEEHAARAAEQRHHQEADAHAAHHAAAPEIAAKKPAAANTGSSIQFKAISDWSKYMPAAMPDQDDRERKRIEKLVKAKVEGERGQAGKMLEGLRASHMEQARDVRAMKPKLLAQVATAQKQALGHVAASEASQCAAVRSHIASVQGQVRGHAATMKGQVTSAHAAAIAKINQTHLAAEQKLGQDRSKADSDVNGSESLALLVLSLDFLALQSKYSALGSAKAGDALTVGEEQAASFSGRWDGEKLEAAQKAARDTADGFASSMPGQAAAKWAEIEKERGPAEQGLKDYATGTRTNLGLIFDQSKQGLDAVKTQSIQAADSAMAAAIAQIDQVCSSTVAALGMQGASQIAAIRKQGQSARTGITQGGAAARANVTSACDQAATGIEGGIAGMIRGAAQLEMPDPDEMHRQVQKGTQDLAQGASGVAKGLSSSASAAADGLNAQASGAAEGMASITASTRTSATQAGAGAKQQMSAIAQGAAKSIAQIATSDKTTTDKSVADAATAFTNQVTTLDTGYKNAATTRADSFKQGYDGFKAGLDQTVPDRGGGRGGAGSGKKEEGGGDSGGGPKGEIPAIQEAAQKAADAVKPWWQKALAVVVSIVVAIVVVVVVTALIAATGPVGMILVGALAGALSTFAAQVASNLVLGNSPLEGVTWQSIAIGALGGAISGGITAGIGAAAKAGVTGARAIEGANAATGALKGAAGLRAMAIREGTEFATDFVSEQAANLIINHKLDISVQDLVIGAVANHVTGGAKFEGFQHSVQTAIQKPIPGGIKVPGLQVQIGVPHAPAGLPGGVGAPATPDVPHAAVPPAGGASGAPTPHGPAATGGPGHAPATAGSSTAGAPTTDGPTAHPAGGPTAHPAGGPAAHPAGPPARPTGDGDGPAAHADDGSPPLGDTGSPPPRNAEPGQATTRPGDNGQPTTRPGDNGQPTARPGDSGQPTARPGDNGQPTAHPGNGDPTTAHGDGDPATAHADGDPTTGHGDTSPTRRDGGDGSKPQTDGAHPAGDPAKPHTDAHGAADPAKAHGPDDAHPAASGPAAHGGDATHGGGDVHPHAADGPATPEAAAAEARAAALDSEMGDLGYSAGTRAKGQEAAARVETGETPPPGALRDTDANVRGARDLDQIRTDPSLSPEQKLELQREVAAQMRAHPEPTGSLPHDIDHARARTRETDGARGGAGPDSTPTRPETTGASGGILHPESSYRGDISARDNTQSVRAGVQEALPTLGALFPDGHVRATGPDRLEIDIDGTPHEVRVEVVPNSQLGRPTDVANFDVTTTPITVRVSSTAEPVHVQRALAHEVAEVSSILTQQAGGTARSNGNALSNRDRSQQPQQLSHDDIGRIAELRVLMNDMQAGRPHAAAEARALLHELGLSGPDGPNTRARRDLVEQEGVRIADIEAAIGPQPIFVGNREQGDLAHVAAAAIVDPSVNVTHVRGDRNGTDAGTTPDQTPLRFVDPDRVTSVDATSNRQMQDIRDTNRNPVEATAIVAEALRTGNIDALRDMDLGLSDGQRADVSAFLDRMLQTTDGRPLVAYWNRAGDYQPGRNSTQGDLDSVHASAAAAGAQVIVFGPDYVITPDGTRMPLDMPAARPDAPGAVDATNHWHETRPDGTPGLPDGAMQIEMFRQLADRGLLGQVGIMSGGMDAPFLFAGTRTIEVNRPDPNFPDRPDRMGQWDTATRNPDGTPGDFEVRPTNPDGSFPDVTRDIEGWRDNPPTSGRPTGPDPTGPAPGGPTITAAAVPGSTFTGRPDRAMSPAERAANAAVNRQRGGEELQALATRQGMSVSQTGPDTYRVQTADGESFTVRVTSEPLAGTEVANSVVNPTKDEHVVRISDQADPAHVERAMAHELAEIMAIRDRHRAGDPTGSIDALAAGPDTPSQLSPHDHGRLAELDVLRRQHDDAVASGDPTRVADVRRELQALVEHLGLREGTPEADVRRQLLEDQGNVSPDTLRLLDDARQPRSELTPDDLTLLDGVDRQAALDDQAAAARADRDRPLYDVPVLGRRVSPAELPALAADAAAARQARSDAVVADLRARAAALPPGEYPRVSNPQLGGGATVTALEPGQLFVDARGRWHRDPSRDIAQTAHQVGGLEAAGSGRPSEFVDHPSTDRVPVDALTYMQDTIAAQADVVNGTGRFHFDDDGRMLMTIQPEDGGPPITVEVEGTPVIGSGFPPENVPRPRQTVEQSRDALLGALPPRGTSPEVDTVRQHLETLRATDQAAFADALRGLPADQVAALRADPRPEVQRALQSIDATGAWLDARAAAPTRVLTGQEANLDTLVTSPGFEDVGHWVIAGPGGTGISAAEIILSHNPSARVTMVGGDPPAGLVSNDQFQRVLAEHGPGGDNRFQIVTGQDISSLVTPDGGATFTAGAPLRGDGHVDASAATVDPMSASSFLVEAANPHAIDHVRTILEGNPAARVSLVGADLTPAQRAALGDLMRTYGPSGGSRLQVVTGPHASSVVSDGAGGFTTNAPVGGEGFIASLGFRGNLPPEAQNLIDAALQRGGTPSGYPAAEWSYGGELLFDADGQYLGYRVTVVTPGGPRSFDVIGGGSRALSAPDFILAGTDPVTGQRNRDLLAAASDRDAPPEGGSFDGGYVASATQGARYGRNRRDSQGPIDGAAADARTAGAFRLDGAADPPLHVDPTSPDRGTGAVADYLAARMGVDPARLHVDPIGGGATGALLFKVKLGDADVGVFKLFPDADDALIEMQILDLLDNAGLDRFHAVGNRTDQPVPVDGGGSGMLMDAAQGGSVASRIQHLSSDPVVREPQLRELERNMQQVAEAMAELHTASGGGQQMDPAARASDAGYVRGKLTNPDTQGRLGPDADDIVAAFDAQVVQFMADPVPRGAYHGDANAGNFMIDGDGVDVIDVGTMQWSLDRTVPGLVGNRTGIADVARFRESLETLAPGALHPDELAHLRATFDDAYAAATGVDPAHIRSARRIYAVEAQLAVLRYNTARDPAIDRRVVANIRAILGLS